MLQQIIDSYRQHVYELEYLNMIITLITHIAIHITITVHIDPNWIAEIPFPYTVLAKRSHESSVFLEDRDSVIVKLCHKDVSTVSTHTHTT